jgi:hypothetical protein
MQRRPDGARFRGGGAMSGKSPPASPPEAGPPFAPQAADRAGTLSVRQQVGHRTIDPA